MSYIQKTKLTRGLHLVEIEDADLRLCCGCPPDAVKFLKKAGHLVESEYASSPNAILLPDSKVQKGRLTNFSEFLIMNMLYNNEMIQHVGTQKPLPILIGLREIIEQQAKYICRGNYGHYSVEEFLENGFDESFARKMMHYKLHFAQNRIYNFDELCRLMPLEQKAIEIKNGVMIHRLSFDKFKIEYKKDSCIIDFANDKDTNKLPFSLNDHFFEYNDFSVIHCGEGNGWEPENPCMGSLLMHEGKIYAIDTGPGFADIINHLGLDIQDLEGVFLTHVHDDHYAGLVDLTKSTRKIRFFSSKMVRVTAQKKFASLLGLAEESFHYFFDVVDLELGAWNNLDGMEVKPCFSPHPVETNAFIFKVIVNGEDKIYSHLADTISIGDIDLFQRGQDGNDISSMELEDIKSNYLLPADIKKVDIGGGAIHGEKGDYLNDPSEKIIFSHTKCPSVKTRNSETTESCFGKQDVLISGYHHEYLLKRLYETLVNNFQDVDDKSARRIFEKGKLCRLSRNEIIRVEDDQVYFLLNGNVTETNVSFDQRILFDKDHILGLDEIFDHSKGIYSVNTSFIDLLICEKKFFKKIVAKSTKWCDAIERSSLINSLSNSRIFNHFSSSNIVLSIGHLAENLEVMQERVLQESELDDIYIFQSGTAHLLVNSQKVIELKPGDFFGGNNVINYQSERVSIFIQPGSNLLKIPFESVQDIPLVWWMIYENNTHLDHLYKTGRNAVQEEMIEALNKSELFRVLDADSLKNVSNMVHKVSASSGDTIVKEGEPSDRLFLIINGIGVVKKGLANEPEKILAYLMPGNTFGEVGILEHKPRSATVAALTDVELIEIPSNLFESLLMKFPKLGIELARLLGYYLTQTNNRITRGNKDNHLITIFNFGKVKSGMAFSESLAKRIYEQTGHRTIFIHYKGKAKKTNLTSTFQIDQVSDHYDRLTNWTEMDFPIDSRISMISDRLLNSYDNLVIYFDDHPKENLSIVFENLNQAILISDMKNYQESLDWREEIKRQVAHRNIEYFMLNEQNANKGVSDVRYRYPERSVSSEEIVSFDLSVKLIADRLERNNRIGIFIPTTYDVDKEFDTTEMVNDALKFLGKTFGGATSEEAIGVWNSKDIGIVDEKVFIVHSYTTAKALRENLNQVVEFVKEMKGKLRQESMALEINKRLTLI